jgi:hypothetical protein
MATKTAGTAATTSLTAIQWQKNGVSAADLATIRNSILQYNVNTSPRVPGAFENGILYYPDNRTPGGFRLIPGDWLMVDGAGFPVVIPSAIFATSWVHS